VCRLSSGYGMRSFSRTTQFKKDVKLAGRRRRCFFTGNCKSAFYKE
jgi:hypothetical protein